MLFAVLKTMRPRQWTKNLLVYIPLLFTLRQYWQPFSREMYAFFGIATAAFLIFCVLASSIYLINDLVDIEKDRLHPTKRNRPIASGRLPKSVAIAAIVVLLGVGIPLAFIVNLRFGIDAVIYLILTISYSFLFKNLVILDVFALAAGYVLRILAGADAISVPPSPWLFVCTMLLALFIGFSKRRHELVLLEDGATNHRVILKEYTAEVLDEMIAVTTASFVMAYSLYTFSAENLPKNHSMMLTIPFALYVVFRLLYQVHVKHEGGSPEELVLRDRPLFGALLAWGLAIIAIFYVYGGT